MRLQALLVGACVLLVPALRADDKPGDSDKDKIQGTWEIVKGERGGQPIPEEEAKMIKITFAGDKLKIKHGDQEQEMTFKLHPDRKPKAIDVDMGDKVGKGIYELKGDTLKIAHGEFGDPRPKEFSNKEGSKLHVVVLKRVKS